MKARIGFLKNLKNWGVEPEVVVTDRSGSTRRCWPHYGHGRHQLCIFHVLKDLHKEVVEPWGGCSRIGAAGKRGREPTGRRRKARAERRGLTNQEKSAFISKRRYLIVKRRERMSPRERLDLEKMLSYLPELKALRDFVDRLEMLFEESQSEALAWGRHAALTSNRRFLAVPSLRRRWRCSRRRSSPR